MEFSKENKQSKITGFLCVVCCVFVFATVWFAFGANRYRRQERLLNERAVSALCEGLDSISTNLKKGVYTADADALERIGNELCRQSASAKENLSLLSFETELCDEVFRFLSQVGDYTLSVSRDNSISENYSQLRRLSEYADSISSALNEICLDYYNGDVSLGQVVGNLDSAGKSIPEDFYSRVSDAAETMTDYPVLVYDGPFSDNLGKKESALLSSEDSITADEAQKKAAEVLSVPASSLRREEDINSQIELYCFSSGGNDITVTKKGGYICTFITDSYALEENIDPDEAVKRGEKHLEKLGYKDMKSSYYSVFDGICTVNFAYVQNGVICYGDLIKVSISLDTGKLTGIDAKNYLLNHSKRSLAAPEVSLQKAEGCISESLAVVDSSLAVIPLENGRETFCHELHCRDEDGNELLVYINALTGKQEDLLLLLYSDGGVLTK